MVRVWVGDQPFDKMEDVKEKIKRILAKYPGDPNAVPKGSQRVTDSNDVAFIETVLASHPDIEEKTGPGIDHFEVRYYDYGTRALCVVRTDGTDRDASLPWAVRHLPKSAPQ